MLKTPIFLSNCGQFTLHKFEKIEFSRQDMNQIFPYGHFCDPWGIPNQKIWLSNPGIFSVFQCFLDHRVTYRKRKQSQQKMWFGN